MIQDSPTVIETSINDDKSSNSMIVFEEITAENAVKPVWINA